MKLHVLGLLFLGLVAGQDGQAAGDGLDARISAERAKIRNDFKLILNILHLRQYKVNYLNLVKLNR